MTSELTAALDDVLDHIDDIADERAKPAPYIAALPADALIVDHSYQRDLDDLRTQRMIDDFDLTLLGVLEVSERADGTYAILDGQHCWAAAVEAHPARATPIGVQLVCQVHRELSVEDEARVFYEIDVRRKQLNGWDRWKARRGSGDTVVLAVEAIVTRIGMAVDPGARDGCISATKALETIYRLGGETLLHNTLFVLGQAYGNVRDAYDGQMLQGAAFVLDTYDAEELDVTRLIAQLQTVPPRQVKARAQGLREVHRAELPRLTAAVMIERYNAGKGRKVEDFLTRAPASSKALSSEGRRSRQLQAIRRWAQREGLPWSASRVPQPTVAAYAQAHPGFTLAAT